MVSLANLWLPILLSGIFVFIASSIIHMALKYHNSDYGRLDAEDAVRDALRPFAIKPGFYAMPNPVDCDWKDPAVKEKYERGPNGFLTITPNAMPGMGKVLGLWFVNCLIVALFAGYVASNTLVHGAPFLAVFRIAGAVAFAGFSLGLLGESIWFHRPWSMTAKHMFDGLIYALITGATFGWLWPTM